MKRRKHAEVPSDLAPVVEMLEAGRPDPSPSELDELKRRVIARASRQRTAVRRGGIMASRIAVVTMLVLGLALGGAGATLAVVGAGDTPSAGVAQYGQPAAGEEGAREGAGELGGTAGAGEAAGLQEGRQVAAGEGDGGELPDTGFAAVALLVAGIGMLAAGLVLRRRAN
jgi:LPXTG-motif cell wall-anchored protein